MDWERSNFSISQCVFNDNMQQNLVAIKSIADSTNTTTSSNTKSDGKSSSGRTIGIVVAVVVVVVLAVCGAVLFLVVKRRKKRREAEEAERSRNRGEDPADAIRQGFAKAELDTNFDHARYEMGGPDVIDQKGEKLPAEWEKGNTQYRGEWSVMAEAPGDGVTVPELASRRITLKPLHEMYDPSVTPVELPADMPRELPGSPFLFPTSNSAASSPRSGLADPSPADRPLGTAPSSRSSAQPSLIDAHHGRTRPPRTSSRHQRSAPSPPSQSPRGISPPSRSKTSSARVNELFSPISPLNDGETSPVHEGHFSSVTGLTQPTSSGIQRSSARQVAGDMSQETSESHSRQ